MTSVKLMGRVVLGCAVDRVGCAADRVGCAADRVECAEDRVGCAADRVGCAADREAKGLPQALNSVICVSIVHRICI